MNDKAKSIAAKIRTLAIGLKYSVSINDMADTLNSIADELDPPEEKTETLAPEGTAEWAWQMSKRGHLIIHRDMHYPIQPPLVGSMEEWCEYHEQDGWKIYDDDLPKYKVGDWVEYEGKQYRIVYVGNCGILGIYDGEIWGIDDLSKLRKLDPSEVRVKITFEGTVCKHLPFPEFYFIIHTPYTEKLIPFEDIDPETRKLVKSLIKAQEEKSN